MEQLKNHQVSTEPEPNPKGRACGESKVLTRIIVPHFRFCFFLTNASKIKFEPLREYLII